MDIHEELENLGCALHSAEDTGTVYIKPVDEGTFIIISDEESFLEVNREEASACYQGRLRPPVDRNKRVALLFILPDLDDEIEQPVFPGWKGESTYTTTYARGLDVLRSINDLDDLRDWLSKHPPITNKRI
jgi:hypothetical protein